MAFTLPRVVLGLVLLSSQGCAAIRTSKSEAFGNMPRHLYRSDCFKRRPVGHAHHQSLLRGAANVSKNPGAGIGEVVPFETVLKDGFFLTTCVKDSMFEHGDKYGDNKFSYSIGDTAGVSIVHYSQHVPKEDQEPMTHSTCFAFCRTVPEMNFFGLVNGRECYCAPYYDMEAGDSSQCDAVCEGAPATMCGGKTKSSVFSMHSCADTAQDLGRGAGTMDAVHQELVEAHTALAQDSGSMQRMAESFQESFGKAGDPAASDSMQSAKVFAGEVAHAAEAGEALAQEMEGLSGQASGMEGADFSDVAKATEAETVVASMEKATHKGKTAMDELGDLKEKITPDTSDDAAADAGKEYYPVMYFVDKEFEKNPSTCAGETDGKPIVGTYGQCAAACDAQVHTCVGFSHYPDGAGAFLQEAKQPGASNQKGASTESGLCFLFSRFNTATHYTACSEETPKVTCAAKLSAFVGQTLKPDGSGKCKQCLKELTKADRCFQ